MFRKMLLAAVLTASATVTVPSAATAQDPPQWKLGVAMTAASGGGVSVNQVFDGSPAQQMDIQVGDVMLTVNGALVTDPLAVRDTIFASDKVSLVVRRGAEYFQKDVTFAAPQVVAAPPPVVGAAPGVVAARAPVVAAAKKITSVTTKKIAPPPGVPVRKK